MGTVEVANLPLAVTTSDQVPFPLELPHRSGRITPFSSTSTSIQTASIGTVSSSSVGMFRSFDGIDETQGGTSVPDVQVAAGPSYVVELSNFAVRIFSKQGTSVKNLTFHQFFNNTRNTGDSLFDPKVFFDTATGRWFASVGDIEADNVTIAVSSTSDPTQSWKIYSLSANRQFADQPIIGVSDDKFVVSANIYSDRSGTVFLGARIWVISKSELLVGQEKVDFSSFGPAIDLESVHPALSQSSTATLFMVTTGGADVGNSDFHFFSVAGTPPGEVIIRAIPLSISSLTPPVAAPQPGTTMPLDTGQNYPNIPSDARVQSAVWFQGKLWFTSNDSCTPAGDNQVRACFRMTQIDTTGSAIVVTQDFDVGARGLYYFYPAVSFDITGNVGVVFGYSSATNSTCCFPSVAVTGQAVGDPPKSFRPPTTLKLGSTSDTYDGETLGGLVRYGDYFGASLDPSNQTVIWVGGEYARRQTVCNGFFPGCWATFVGSVRVESAGFAISSNPTYATMMIGSTNSSAVSLTSIGGFAGTVSLSADFNLGLALAFSPSVVTLAPGGLANSTLTLSMTASAPAGTYTVTVNGASGTLRVPATMIVFASGFNVSASPTSLNFPTSSSNTSAIMVSGINNFVGTVVLKVTVSPLLDRGPTLTINPSSITVTSGGAIAALLTASVKPSTSTGIYRVTVTGSQGGQWHRISIAVAVTPIDVRVNSRDTFGGVEISSTGSLHVGSSLTTLTLSGTISIETNYATTKALLFSHTYSVGIPISSTSSGDFLSLFLLEATVSPYPLSATVNVTFSGTAVSSSVRVFRSVDVDLDGVVDTADIIIFSAAFHCGQGSSCYNPRADLNADGVVDILDASILGSYFGAVSFLPNYVISGNPGNLSFASGSSLSSTLTIVSISNFVGKMNLSVSVSPAGLSTSVAGLVATLSSSSITLGAGGSTTCALAVSSTSFGDFDVKLTSTSGLLSRSVILPVHVVDFRIIVLGASTAKATTGRLGIFPLALVSINGFSGNIGFEATVAPNVTNGPTASFGPSSITLISGSFNFTFLSLSTVNTPQINYTIATTATSGSLSHSANSTLRVNDFYLTVLPASLDLPAGGSISVSVQGTSVNGYANHVSLSVLGLPSCISAELPSAGVLSVNLPQNPASLTMRINAAPNCSGSTSIITVEALDPGSPPIIRHAYFVLTVSEFRVSASPSAIGIFQGTSRNLTLTATSLNDYPSTWLKLSVSGVPTCTSINFNPASPLRPLQGVSNSTILTLTITAQCSPGTFTFAIQANDTRIVRNVSVSLVLGSFSIAVSPYQMRTEC